MSIIVLATVLRSFNVSVLSTACRLRCLKPNGPGALTGITRIILARIVLAERDSYVVCIHFSRFGGMVAATLPPVSLLPHAHTPR